MLAEINYNPQAAAKYGGAELEEPIIGAEVSRCRSEYLCRSLQMIEISLHWRGGEREDGGEREGQKKCEAMEGITKEGESIIEETDEGTATRDVGLVLAAQKVEHYEISTYGGLAQLARTLGKTDIAELLAKTLKEEKMADELLTDIAEEGINYEAAHEHA